MRNNTDGYTIGYTNRTGPDMFSRIRPLPKILEEIMSYTRIAGEIVDEVHRSLDKHGDQRHVPLGMGPETLPLDLGVPVYRQTRAEALALLATRATDARSFSQGDGSVTWRDILTEEVFEAYAEQDPQHIREEMIQVAAVAMKIIDKIDADARS